MNCGGERERAESRGRLSPTEIEAEKKRIDTMSQEEMARLWRFAPAGHPYFDSTLPLYEYFKARFDSLGGFTPAISKRIGWGP